MVVRSFPTIGIVRRYVVGLLAAAGRKRARRRSWWHRGSVENQARPATSVSGSAAFAPPDEAPTGEARRSRGLREPPSATPRGSGPSSERSTLVGDLPLHLPTRSPISYP